MWGQYTYHPGCLEATASICLASDPDAPALTRPDGTVVARFGARGMTVEAIEQEALEDLLLRVGRQGEVRL